MAAKRNTWTDDDMAVVQALAPLGIGELRLAFPRRTDHAIRGAAYRLGIHIPRTGGRTEWQRGRLKPPAHCHPLVKAIYAEANRQRAFLYEVAGRAGVTRAAISRWGHQRHPHLAGLEAVANALGLELALRTRREEREAA
jgi:hypothetical protein